MQSLSHGGWSASSHGAFNKKLSITTHMRCVQLRTTPYFLLGLHSCWYTKANIGNWLLALLQLTGGIKHHQLCGIAQIWVQSIVIISLATQSHCCHTCRTLQVPYSPSSVYKCHSIIPMVHGPTLHGLDFVLVILMTYWLPARHLHHLRHAWQFMDWPSIQPGGFSQQKMTVQFHEFIKSIGLICTGNILGTGIFCDINVMSMRVKFVPQPYITNRTTLFLFPYKILWETIDTVRESNRLQRL